MLLSKVTLQNIQNLSDMDKNLLNSLRELQSDDSARLSLHTLSPELEFRVYGAMKQEVII